MLVTGKTKASRAVDTADAFTFQFTVAEIAFRPVRLSRSNDRQFFAFFKEFRADAVSNGLFPFEFITPANPDVIARKVTGAGRFG